MDIRISEHSTTKVCEWLFLGVNGYFKCSLTVIEWQNLRYKCSPLLDNWNHLHFLLLCFPRGITSSAESSVRGILGLGAVWEIVSNNQVLSVEIIGHYHILVIFEQLESGVRCPGWIVKNERRIGLGCTPAQHSAQPLSWVEVAADQTPWRRWLPGSAVAEESELYKKLGTLKTKAMLTKSFKGPMET